MFQIRFKIPDNKFIEKMRIKLYIVNCYQFKTNKYFNSRKHISSLIKYEKIPELCLRDFSPFFDFFLNVEIMADRHA